METNYFVCTLGEAAHAHHRPYSDINQLVVSLARECPDLPAVGFLRHCPDRNGKSLQHDLFTFKQVQTEVCRVASVLQAKIGLGPGQPVGLLCSSSLDFLWIWLACIRLGCPVLLLAPECSASDIVQLCQSCDVSLLLIDRKHEELSQLATEQAEQGTLRCARHPFDHAINGGTSEPEACGKVPEIRVKETDVAYWHHSSGTSSGVPKPIKQTHRGAVGALPALNGSQHATFTTTPLYHGGPADLFRAWTSQALIWFFPGRDLPITASNVGKCLSHTCQVSHQNHIPEVAYFTSVPFILESMLADRECLNFLRTMDLVGVGGASLSQDIGDKLTNSGVNLVSRYGSAECGFLLSSHRDYSQDSEWAYLRVPNDSTQLVFEPRDSGLFELIMLPQWPHLAKTNRDDGSYATDDLFSPHPTYTGVWKYHSPAGARLTLSTGKKFDPTSIERAARASPLVEDAFVFGSGRAYPGVLLFRAEAASDLTDSEFAQQVKSLLESVATSGPVHARIPREMAIPMPFSPRPIDKSSKGTILRNKAVARYITQIDQAYNQFERIQVDLNPGEDLCDSIRKIVSHVLRTQVCTEADADLVSMGVDSIAAIRIRKGLLQLIPNGLNELPMNIVEDCGSVRALAGYMSQVRGGNSPIMTSVNDTETMMKLVEQYGTFTASPERSSSYEQAVPSKAVVILTGSTGALGATVLVSLVKSKYIAKIYCLVRADNAKHAKSKIEDVLRERQLASIDWSRGNVEVLPCKLGSPSLGLSKAAYSVLASEATVIMHLAWSVNFRMSLASFGAEDLAGVRNLIDLALASSQPQAPMFAYCSSVASVAALSSNPIPEEIIDDPHAAAEVGYAKSKWVAEQVCKEAAGCARLRGKVSVFRVGQLSGHSETGVWNRKEAWPMMLSTAKLLGCLPDLSNEVLAWLPVDVAAEAFVEGAMAQRETAGVQVYHVINNQDATTWGDLVGWLAAKTKFDLVSPSEWLAKLESAAAAGCQHPAVNLLGHWKKTLLNDKKSTQSAFSTSQTTQTIPRLRNVRTASKDYAEKLWTWIDGVL